MNRRSVLGMLGIGATVGPSVVAQAASEYTKPSNLLGSSGALTSPGIDWSAEKTIQWNPADELKRVKQEYEFLVNDRSSWITNYIAREYEEIRGGYASNYRYENIDPDIRNMKSISESAKLRMFIERRANYKYESIKNSMFTQIQSLMKQV